MPVLVKDFDKSVTDFFKENSGFKYEAKSKGPLNTIYINPEYEKGVLTVNAHYDAKDKNNSVKTVLGLSDNNQIATKVTLERDIKKLEVTNRSNLKNLKEYSGEIIHQLSQRDVCFYVKSAYSSKARTNLDAQLSLMLHKHLQVGAQIVFNSIKKYPDSYKVGARYSCCANNQFALTVDNKRVASFSSNLNLKEAGLNLNTFLRLTYAMSSGTGLNFGVQHMCSQTAIRSQWKVDCKGNYGVNFMRRFGDLSVLVGGNAKFSKMTCPLAPNQVFIWVTRE